MISNFHPISVNLSSITDTISNRLQKLAVSVIEITTKWPEISAAMLA